MPDILIRGLKMPVEQPLDLTIDPSGCVWFPAVNKNAFVHLAGCEAKELPPHGGLIDRNEIKTNMIDEVLGKTVSYVNMEQIKNAPVIIPADKEENNI